MVTHHADPALSTEAFESLSSYERGADRAGLWPQSVVRVGLSPGRVGNPAQPGAVPSGGGASPAVEEQVQCSWRLPRRVAGCCLSGGRGGALPGEAADEKHFLIVELNCAEQ